MRNISSGLIVPPTRAVVGHCESVLMHDATFAVQPAGRAKVLRDKRKNVHAFVRGEIDRFNLVGAAPVIGGWWEPVINSIMTDPNMVEVTYNPYKFDSFVDKNTLTPVRQADRVYIVGKSIYAVGVQ